MKDQDPPKTSTEWIERLSKGMIGEELDVITLDGIKVLEAQKGFIRCSFVAPVRLADKDGNWDVGAMATLIDTVGAATVFSFAGHVKASLDLSISFYSTAKIQEEVEIEAQVVGRNGKLTSAQVEVRRKDNGELIALGKQWVSSSQASKL